jgi:arginine metabolism regulation protein II
MPRNALINALLSISAFNLAQKFVGVCHSSEIEKWSKAAQEYRFRAVNFLKTCLEVDFKQPSKVRYKEILAAMLSMVTIDVSCHVDVKEESKS